MNTNLPSAKHSPRMDRIRIVSRIVRYVFLVFFAVSICVFLFSISSALQDKWNAPFGIGLGIMLCIWYWKLAQLFGFYERGLIFASETVRCIKFLGLLCAMEWMLLTIWHVVLQNHPLPSLQSTLPPGITVTVKKLALGPMGFFSFNFAGINFGLLLAGIVIILIAWIMDEGRKIQDEQELTV